MFTNGTTTTGLPPTGCELLATAIHHTDLVIRKQLTWRALGAAETAAVAAIVTQVLPGLTTTAANHGRVADRALAWEVFQGLRRGLAAAPNTLKALSKATPSPVHGSERAMLAGAVARKLAAAGYVITDDVARTVTYTLADIVGRALAAPAVVPALPVRPGMAPLTTGPALDHDEYHWATGIPLNPAPVAVEAAA